MFVFSFEDSGNVTWFLGDPVLEAKSLLHDWKKNPWEGVENVCLADGEKQATKDAKSSVQFVLPSSTVSSLADGFTLLLIRDLKRPLLKKLHLHLLDCRDILSTWVG